MGLRRRMFRSYTIILLTTLLILMVIAGAGVMLFADAFLKDFERIDNAKVDSKFEDVLETMQESKDRAWEELDQALSANQYHLFVLEGSQLRYGEDAFVHKFKERVLENFALEKHTSEEPEVFFYQGITVVGQYHASTGTYQMAVNFQQKDWWKYTYRHSFTMFFVVFAGVGLLAILLLLFISSIFTKKLCTLIMTPLDLLLAGTKRIGEGNLTQAIAYHGDKEFEIVCNAFDEMQHAMDEGQQRIMADEKARNDMITGISHDLRTPLTSIQGYIKGVLDQVAATPEKQKEYLQTAYSSTLEMNILLQKLFDFSRLETGQMPFHKVNVNLVEFIENYIAKKELELKQNKVEIMLQFPQDVIEIDVDVDQIRRILDNLLENTIRYAHVCPIHITITMELTSDALHICWQDNGDGVEEEKLPHIFERFYRCDEARTVKGSGVGLYVVKSIMEQHGGWVRSENASGLQIHLYFQKEGV